MASNSHVETTQRTVPLGERVRRLLESRNMSLAHVAQEAVKRFGSDPNFRIPHNLYYELASGDYSPKIHHVYALSNITNYRLVDWLTVFGFRLDDITRLTSGFARRRTTLLDSRVYDTRAFVEWFSEKPSTRSSGPIVPASQLWRPGAFVRIDSLLSQGSPFCFVKIGMEDAFAFPDLLPGSVVRVDTQRVHEVAQLRSDECSRQIFLVEHARGLVCCRLTAVRSNRILLRSVNIPYAQVDLELGEEARVLGVVDLEFRPVGATHNPRLPSDLVEYWLPSRFPIRASKPSLREILTAARSNAHLSLREASALSRQISEILNNSKYFCAPGSLSDFESSDVPPRHIQKIFALCIIYAIGFWDFLEAIGLNFAQSGNEPMPDRFVLGRMRQEQKLSQIGVPPSGITGEILLRLHEIPLFLRNSLNSITSVSKLTLRNIYWVGRMRRSLHPFLREALLVAVDRSRKRPEPTQNKPVWQQPLWMLLLRTGKLLLTGCSAQNGTLVLHPFSHGSSRPRRLRNRIDAEVVGKVTAILRILR